MLNTMRDQFRTHKARIKRDYYTKFKTDDERMKHRPRDVPLKDFRILLDYWGDDNIKVTSTFLCLHQCITYSFHYMHFYFIVYLIVYRPHLKEIKRLEVTWQTHILLGQEVSRKSATKWFAHSSHFFAQLVIWNYFMWIVNFYSYHFGFSCQLYFFFCLYLC